MMTMTLAEYKAEFKNRVGIHFNNAGMSPISNRVAIRANAMITEFNFYASLHDQAYLADFQSARERLAQYLGADTDEVAYFPNCASALSQIAFGQELSSNDTLVTIDQEYASNFYPWKEACARSGAKLVVIESGPAKQIDFDELKSAIVKGVRCVGVSWVQFQTGAILDLKALGDHCHSVGAKLVVDGIQGIGQLPISFRDLPVDALVGASHKWVSGLNGQGFTAVKQDWIQKLKPVTVGSGTFNRFGTFATPDATIEMSARRFEPGGLNFVSLFALDEAIALQMEVGLETIAAEISRLSFRFRSALKNLSSRGVELITPFDQVGGITSFKLPIEAEAKLMARFQAEDIAIVRRGEFIRASIHAFNQDDEIDQVIELIQQALGAP